MNKSNFNEMNIEDYNLTELLKEAYSDSSAYIRPERTGDIMKAVRNAAAPNLTDDALTFILNEVYKYDPELIENENRTANIMMAVKSDARQENYLADAELSAILKDAYDDDVAFEEASGRTHRIMRRISTAILRPMADFQRQISFAAIAISAAVVMFFINSNNHTPPDINMANSIVMPGKQLVSPAIIAENTLIINKSNNKSLKSKQIKIKQVNIRSIKNTHKTNSAINNLNKKSDVLDVVNNAVEIARIEPSTQRVAAALYSSGTIAHASGDYNTAYDAYSTSYELSPSPETLLATGQVLVEDAKVMINKEVDWL